MNEILEETELKMESCIENMEKRFTNVRAGRANPAILDGVMVAYYGVPTPLKQLINDFAFDVEYIYIAKLNNLSMYELGITWSDDRGSTVSPIKSSFKFFGDIFFIRRHKKSYFFEPQSK